MIGKKRKKKRERREKENVHLHSSFSPPAPDSTPCRVTRTRRLQMGKRGEGRRRGKRRSFLPSLFSPLAVPDPSCLKDRRRIRRGGGGRGERKRKSTSSSRPTEGRSGKKKGEEKGGDVSAHLWASPPKVPSSPSCLDLHQVRGKRCRGKKRERGKGRWIPSTFLFFASRS